MRLLKCAVVIVGLMLAGCADNVLFPEGATIAEGPKTEGPKKGALPVSPATSAPAVAGKKVALVVGNAAYQHAPRLALPTSDAKAMSVSLQKLGFDVQLTEDLYLDGMVDALSKFHSRSQNAEVVLFFFSGHGVQWSGNNYLLPVDNKLATEVDLTTGTVKLDDVVKQMNANAKTSIVLLDACRDNPLVQTLAKSLGPTKSMSVAKGLASISGVQGKETFIAFATGPGAVALDRVSSKDRTSPFTTAFVRHISVPHAHLSEIMIDVTREVEQSTGGRQVPWATGSLRRKFFFTKAPLVANAAD